MNLDDWIFKEISVDMNCHVIEGYNITCVLSLDEDREDNQMARDDCWNINSQCERFGIKYFHRLNGVLTDYYEQKLAVVDVKKTHGRNR